MTFVPPLPGAVPDVTPEVIAAIKSFSWEDYRLVDRSSGKPVHKYLRPITGVWHVVAGAPAAHGMSHWTYVALASSKAQPDGSVITANGTVAHLQGTVADGKRLAVLTSPCAAEPDGPVSSPALTTTAEAT